MRSRRPPDATQTKKSPARRPGPFVTKIQFASELVAQAATNGIDPGRGAVFLAEVVVQIFGPHGKAVPNLVFEARASCPAEVGATRLRQSGEGGCGHFGMAPAGAGCPVGEQ